MLTLNGQKMSKSTGNSILPGEILSGDNDKLSKPFSASVVRFFCMQAHYRSILDFSSDALEASEKGYLKMMTAFGELKNIKTSSSSTINIGAWKQHCYDAMNDDFNTPILIAQLFEGVKIINQLKEENETISVADLALLSNTMQIFIFDVLGLENNTASNENGGKDKLNGVVEMLIKMRKNARDNKDWALSDEIRDDLLSLGIQLKDGKDGTTFLVN